VVNVSAPICVVAWQGSLNGSPSDRRVAWPKWGFVDLANGMTASAALSLDPVPDCRTCGACCAFSREWPRFTTEDDGDLDRIPRAFVDNRLGRMRCDGDRCVALVGEVGIATSCAVYAVRPEVCRACEPGDDACRMARLRFGL
jgi:hypothetical protein